MFLIFCQLHGCGKLAQHERHRDPTDPQEIPTVRGAHEHGLFIDWATTRGALADGTTEEFASYLAVLPDDERRTTPRHPTHQRPGTKVATFDPEVILSDVFQHLRNQAALLGMAILAQQDIRIQHTVTVQVVKTGITPQLAPADRLREAETVPLHPAGRLHTLR